MRERKKKGKKEREKKKKKGAIDGGSGMANISADTV